MSGVRFCGLGYLLGGAGCHNLSALNAAVGSEVDHPVRGLNDVQMVLDNDYRVAEVCQSIENIEQLFHIVEMKAGRRFVEDVQGLAGRPFAKFLGELDALCLATGKSRGGLSQADVTQSHVDQRLQPRMNLRNR